MAMAGMTSMETVNGSSRATAMVELRPGRAPIMTPPRVPAKMTKREKGSVRIAIP